MKEIIGKIMDNGFFLKTIGFVIACTIFVILVPQTLKNLNGTTNDNLLIVYESSWLFLGQIFSTVLTIVILGKLLNNLPKDTNNKAKVVSNLSLWGLIITLLSTACLLIYLVSIRFFGSIYFLPVEIFYLYTLLIIIFFSALDYYAFQAKVVFSNLNDSNAKFIKQYNIIVLIGFIITYIIGKYLEKNYSHDISVGFASGSGAFQLLIAHWLFNLDNYKIITKTT
jgi:hypothetical protein